MQIITDSNNIVEVKYENVDITRIFKDHTQIFQNRKCNCKEWLDSGYNTSGVYTIFPTPNNPMSVYCDQVNNGGGWTYIIGAGSHYNYNHSFWNGTNPGDGLSTTFDSFNMSSTNSAELIKSLEFKELLMREGSTSYVYPSTNTTTFAAKKSAGTSFSGLTWNFVPGYGYTYSRFLLGKSRSGPSYDDYTGEGIGMYGYASSRGTTYGTSYDGYNCGNSERCLYNSGHSLSATIGWKQHRSLNSTTFSGIFFR